MSAAPPLQYPESPAASTATSTVHLVSGAQRARELTRAHEHREADELRLGLGRAFGYGVFIYALFFLVDAFIITSNGLETPLALPLALRLAGAAVLSASHRLLLARPLPMRLLVLVSAATLAATGLLGALVAARAGGLGTHISDGMAFYFLGASVFGPSPWVRMLAITAPVYVVYFMTLYLAAPDTGDAALQTYLADLAINAGLVAFACIGSHILWQSRRHLAEVRRLGRYRLDTLLERDALTESWRAHDPTRGSDVALELYRVRPLPQNTAQPGGPHRITGEHDGRCHLPRERQVRFFEAASAVAALDAPEVMRVFDFGATDDGIAFIARDFIAGERLDALVRRSGPLPAIQAVRLIRRVARAMTEAHRRGVTHRDLRPSNIFVSPDVEAGSVRIIGWGLADLVRSPEARDALRLASGPELFLAPETWSGLSGVRVDVYGLGALLYWCLTGTAPVEVRAGEAPWRAHARTRVTRPSETRGELLPVGLDALTLACLDADPMARPADAAEVARMLDALPIPG